MIITNNPGLRESVFGNIREAVSQERVGIHLSDVIYCTRKAYFRKKGLSPPPSKELCLLWLTGYAFQSYLFPKDEEVSFLVDGINCTPDIPSGKEVKSTRQSMKKFDADSMEHWKRQILGYCKALNKLEYDLVVMFVCGSYAPPFPDVDCWHIEATQEEVDINWKLVLGKALKLQEALVTNTPPEPDCMSWEYEFCENIELCQDTQCWAKKSLRRKK